MGKNLIDQGILAFGGKDGGIISDGSTATAVSTGLQAVWIEVLSDTTFSTLSGWDYTTATAYEGMGVNVPAGVATKAGARFGCPYGVKYWSISHNGGQISYFTAKDS